MFGHIAVPFGAKMLFNSITLKPGITFDDVELAVGEMCSVVKDTYGGDRAVSSPGRYSGLWVRRKGRSAPPKRPLSIM